MTDQPQAEAPEFDLSELSWEDSAAIDLAGMRASKAIKAQDADEAEKAFAAIRQTLATCVVSMPRTWLVGRAPEAIDWSDPASFRWLRATHMQLLLAAFREAQRPEAVTKN